MFKFTDIFISDGIKLFDWRIFIRDRARQPIRRMVEIGLKAKERAMRANSPIEGCATVNNTDPLFHMVPVGEENAVTGRLLWRQLGLGALSTAKLKLNRMAEQNLIVRKRATKGAFEYSLYFKQISSQDPL